MDTLRAPPQNVTICCETDPRLKSTRFFWLIQVLTNDSRHDFQGRWIICGGVRLQWAFGLRNWVWNWIRKGHHSGIGFLGLELTVGLYQNVSQSISFPGRKMTEDLDHNLESKKPPFWFPSTFMRSDIAPVSWRPCFSFMAFSVCLALKMLEKNYVKVRLESKFAQLFYLSQHITTSWANLEFQPDQWHRCVGWTQLNFPVFPWTKFPVCMVTW